LWIEQNIKENLLWKCGRHEGSFIKRWKSTKPSFDHKPVDEEERINAVGGHVVGESTKRINERAS